MAESWTTLTESEFPHRRVTSASGVAATVLTNGQLQTLAVNSDGAGSTLINLFVASPLVGSATRIYLRELESIATEPGRVIGWAQLLGPHSVSDVHELRDGFRWSGRWNQVAYRVDLRLHPQHSAWCWQVDLQAIRASEDPPEGRRFDVILSQDVGLAARGQVQNNEAYTSQYIDHQIATHPALGPVAMARQNLPQAAADGAAHPWLIHGCVVGPSSDLGNASAGVRRCSPRRWIFTAPPTEPEGRRGSSIRRSGPRAIDRASVHVILCSPRPLKWVPQPVQPIRAGGCDSWRGLWRITPRPAARRTRHAWKSWWRTMLGR